MRWDVAISAGAVHPQRSWQPGVPRPEGGQSVLAIGDNRHAEGFQNLECFRQVKDCLGTCTDHGDRRLRQLVQVSRNIERRLCPAMYPADAAVAKTSIPAKRAAIIVAATVVAPVPPVAMQAARSARDSLVTLEALASATS